MFLISVMVCGRILGDGVVWVYCLLEVFLRRNFVGVAGLRFCLRKMLVSGDVC